MSDIEVCVATAKGGSNSDPRVCHEPHPEDGVPRCKSRSRGRYRVVDPTVYPSRRGCTQPGCWDDGIPDVVESE